MQHKKYDIIVVGAGAVGCAIARELSRFGVKLCVLEKEYDVAAGTSGRNSAVVHAGFNNRPGSLMARLCVEGSEGFEALCAQLDVPYKKTGKLVVAFSEGDMETLQRLLNQGRENGCKGLRIVGREELQAIFPGVGGIAALYSPNTAIFDPFLYTIALAENAHENGARFFFGAQVSRISRVQGLFEVQAGEDVFEAPVLINSAGVHAARVSALAGCPQYKIYPCRGEYLILDKIAEKALPIPVYPAPVKGIGGLGVHLTPTIHGNVIIGPSAEYIDGSEDYASTQAIIDKLFTEAKALLPSLDRRQVIGAYAGIRAKQAGPSEGGYHDFVIREEPSVPGLINLIGIESPGMTASMPIARRVRELVASRIPLREKKDFQPAHKRILRLSEQPEDVKARLIRQNPAYGDIVCRCQQVSLQEIREAIENPLGVKTIAGIKYRVWATTGRCNGGYCLSRIAEILEKEYGMSPEEITLRGPGSELTVGRVK